ncbi:alkaline phosphatase family protein [Streptomyces sp. NPDC059104]|uniref:alkaline phosphatase family protein n=1 Tax=Streptomyces sp. NPDC059104 TaxID=3346729 RepID=UPI003693BD7F
MQVTEPKKRRKLLIFCIDGGVPAIVDRHDFFAVDRWVPGLRCTPVSALPTVFPSSTAPAHASFLTGRHPQGHGIVGNAFWSGEPVADIRSRSVNPFASVHPYERSALTAPSLLDWCEEEGLSAAAVQFPHTFSRSAGEAAIPSVYCLYAPGRSATVRLQGGTGTAELAYFDQMVRLTFSVCEGEPDQVLVSGGLHGTEVRFERGTARRLEVRLDEGGHLSIPLTILHLNAERIDFTAATAVLSTPYGEAMAGLMDRADPDDGPSSLAPDYTANPHHDFHESPRAPWVKDTALAVLDEIDPDVLFVRFNQADHAQEYLYWHAVRADVGLRERAEEQILDAYRLIERQVGEIVRRCGDDADYVFFSDHGIDYVETHLRPNAVLDELGLGEELTFRGDSNIAYLYSDRPLSQEEEQRLTRALAAADDTIEVVTAAVAERWQLPWGSARLGRLAITCGPHREFQYGPGSAREDVTSASHGYFPDAPSMNGFFRAAGRLLPETAPPAHLVDVAGYVRNLYRG